MQYLYVSKNFFLSLYFIETSINLFTVNRYRSIIDNKSLKNNIYFLFQ